MAKGILGNPRMQGNSEEIVSATFQGIDIRTMAGKAVTLVGRTEVGNPIVAAFDGVGFFGFVNANDISSHTKTLSVTRKGLDVPVLLVDGADFSEGVGLNANGVACSVADAVYILNASVNQEDINVIDYGAKEVAAVAIDLYGGGAVPAADAPAV
ncbi:hypothetical protein P7245_22415 [Vibrio parahaemolyticus]|nr:hypothetical protein [Vibrio parahaemolyticus]